MNLLLQDIQVIDDRGQASGRQSVEIREGKIHAVPSVCASIAIAQPHVAGHTHEFMEASGSDEANEATIRATKAIALTCVDLLTSDKLMNDVKTSFEKMRKENTP